MTTAPSLPPPPRAQSLADRLWPEPPAAVRPVSLALAAVAGVLAALVLPGAPPGLGLGLVGALAGAAAALQGGRSWTRPELALAGLAGVLLTVPAVRDAEWLVFLCLLAAAGLGALAVSRARTWVAALLTPAAVPLAGLRALPWASRQASPGRPGPRTWVAVLRTGVVTALLLTVFGALLVSADAAFARLVELLLPDLRLGELPGRLVLGAVVTAAALAASYLAAGPPRWALLRVPAARAARRSEWLVPVAALDLLLLAFLVVQSAALFGGADHVRATTGLTWAEYARSGFGQLVAVTALALVVVAAAVRWAPRTDPHDRLAVRAALGLLLALTLAVAVSALMRLSLYEQAFGTTRARLVAGAVEVWLVVVLLLVALAGARWPHPARVVGGLPRTVAATAGLTLLALAVLDADGLVARRSVDRHAAGLPVDTTYLGQLSADAVPELDRLPEPERSCALDPIARRLAAVHGGWWGSGWAGGNAARSTARSLLAERPLRPPDDDTCAQPTGVPGAPGGAR